MTPALYRADLAVLRFVLAVMAALLVASVIFGCASAPTPRGIARGLDACLQRQGERTPAGVKCDRCVAPAERACLAATDGRDARCFADGWSDADRDGWTLAACRERRAGR